MTNVTMIKKFASDACQVISACQDFIGELKAELDAKNAQLSQLSKTASAPAKPFTDADMLTKAASAVHAVYGNPSNVSVEDIARAWNENPAYTLGVITKLASELQNRAAATAEGLGQRIAKRAAAEPVSADEMLRRKYM